MGIGGAVGNIDFVSARQRSSGCFVEDAFLTALAREQGTACVIGAVEAAVANTAEMAALGTRLGIVAPVAACEVHEPQRFVCTLLVVVSCWSAIIADSLWELGE